MKSFVLIYLWLTAAGFGLMVTGCASGGPQGTSATDPAILNTAMTPTPDGSWDTMPSTASNAAPNHLELARQLIDLGHFQVALTQLDQVKGKAGRGSDCGYLRGVCRLEMGELVQAAGIFEQILDRDPEYSPACNGMGLTLARQNRFEAAVPWFERAWALDPAKANAGSNLGYALIRSHQPDRAETVLRRCLVLDPGFVTARNNLALCLGLRGKDTEALALLTAVYPASVARRNLAAIQQYRRQPLPVVSDPAASDPGVSDQDQKEIRQP